MNEDANQAVEILKDDHRRIEQLFKQFMAPHGDSISLAQTICQLLLVHLRMEEQLFYPAVRKLWKGKTLSLDEAESEHSSIRHLIEQVDGLAKDDPMLFAHMKVLREQVVHHLEEEESDLLPGVGELHLDFDQLGADMVELKEKLHSAMMAISEKVGGGRDRVSIGVKLLERHHRGQSF
jgi:hypothetical protein